jgi:hypothetical protein
MQWIKEKENRHESKILASNGIFENRRLSTTTAYAQIADEKNDIFNTLMRRYYNNSYTTRAPHCNNRRDIESRF